MADAIPTQLYYYEVNGVPYLEELASSNVPSGARVASKADILHAALVKLQIEQGNIAAGRQNQDATRQNNAQARYNALGGDAAYNALANADPNNLTPEQLAAVGSVTGTKNVATYYNGGTTPSNLVMAVDPLTGKTVQRTTQEVAQDQAHQDAVKNGTEIQIAPGEYVPANSAAAQQFQGQQVTATVPQTDSGPARVGGAIGSSDIVQGPTNTPVGTQTGTQGTQGTTQGTSTGTTGTTDTSTLPPELQDLKNQLQAYLDKLKANGQGINQNVQITPELAAQFLAQAQSEINPYYAGQLKLAREGLLSSVGYSRDQILQKETDLQRTYGTNLRQLGESAADNGFALSGLRKRDEGDLATTTQNTIDQGRQALSNATGNAERSFAQTYGTSQLPTDLSISNAPRVLAGTPNFSSSNGNSPLYTLSPDVYNGLTGTQEYQQRADIANRSSQLEDAYRTQQSINQQRQLTL